MLSGVVPLESKAIRDQPSAGLGGQRPPEGVALTNGPDGGTRNDGEVPGSIVEAASKGDGEAFAVIMRAYAPRLRATAHQVLRDDQVVDDVLQDVFISAYRALPRFRGDAALSTWLHRITYTTCAQYLRRAVSPAWFVEPAPSDGRDASVPDHAESVGDRQRVRQALGGLSAEQRIVVLLVDRDGYDYRAAARVLGVPGVPWLRGSTPPGRTSARRLGSLTVCDRRDHEGIPRRGAGIARRARGGPGATGPRPRGPDLGPSRGTAASPSVAVARRSSWSSPSSRAPSSGAGRRRAAGP